MSRIGAVVTLGAPPFEPEGDLDFGVRDAIRRGVDKGGHVVVITGAGVSAESGIPVYRGEKGTWTKGGQEAMMMATAQFFHEHPAESWAWYLRRRTEAAAAHPNRAHIAIAAMGLALGESFTLVGQNIDRLHLRAGSALEQTIELHGHLEGVRCIGECAGVFPVPNVFDGWRTEDGLSESQLSLLSCPLCGGPGRPHVLWFDEFYDEANYRFASAQRAVANASLCITVGTSGGVPVAARLAGIAARAGAVLIDVNTRDNPLRRLANRHGGSIENSATSAMPMILNSVVAAMRDVPRSRISAHS